MTAPLLELRGLSCGYRHDRPVLRAVDLTVHAGQTVALLGPSGSGKTALVKTVVGALPPRTGELRVLGASHPERPEPGAVGYVPQGLGLVRHATVLRNVLAGTLRQASRRRGVLGAFTPHQQAAARAAIEQVGLGHLADTRVLHLSGGERRRVAVARALAQRPRLLVADEMLSELDGRTAAVVLDAVAELRQRHGTGVLIVEHDVEAACAVADLVCCVRDSTLLTAAPPGPNRARHVREVLAGAPTSHH